MHAETWLCSVWRTQRRGGLRAGWRSMACIPTRARCWIGRRRRASTLCSSSPSLTRRRCIAVLPTPLLPYQKNCHHTWDLTLSDTQPSNASGYMVKRYCDVPATPCNLHTTQVIKCQHAMPWSRHETCQKCHVLLMNHAGVAGNVSSSGWSALAIVVTAMASQPAHLQWRHHWRHKPAMLKAVNVGGGSTWFDCLEACTGRDGDWG